MNGIDLFLLIVLALAFITGYYKGFIRQLGSVFSLLAGIIASYYFAAPVAERLSEFAILPKQYINTVSYALSFAVVSTFVFLLVRMVATTVRSLGLGIIDRLMGALFSMVKWTLILSLMINLVSLLDKEQAILSKQKRETSRLYEPVGQVAVYCFPFVRQYIDELTLFQ